MLDLDVVIDRFDLLEAKYWKSANVYPKPLVKFALTKVMNSNISLYLFKLFLMHGTPQVTIIAKRPW